jgi:hypothetical protein
VVGGGHALRAAQQRALPVLVARLLERRRKVLVLGRLLLQQPALYVLFFVVVFCVFFC